MGLRSPQIANPIQVAHQNPDAGVVVLKWLVGLAFALALMAAQAVSAQGRGPGQDTRRLAMVVGNGAYDAMAPIDHATGDARDIATVLEQLGFQVSLLINSDSLTFSSAMASFSHRAKGADTVLFYFAGHGFQFDGSNYLVPVDARLSDLASATKEAANLEETLAQLAAGAKRTIVLLDAGYDIPLPPGIQGSALRGLSVPGIGAETFVAYASQPGAPIPASNSAEASFTQALRAHMPTTGQTLTDMIAEARGLVQQATTGQQTPWEKSSLSEPFFFAPFRPSPDDIQKVAAMPEAQRAFLLSIWRGQGSTLTIDALEDRLAREAAIKPAPTPVAAPADQSELTEGVPEALLERMILSMTAVRLDPLMDNRRRLVGRDITDLASALQTELKRLGCYRARVDGTWGGGSRNALRRFIKASGETGITDLKPSVVTLDILLATEDDVCAAPVVRRTPAPAASSGSSSPSVAAPAPQASAPAAPTAPAATDDTTRSLGRSLGNAFR